MSAVAEKPVAAVSKPSGDRRYIARRSDLLLVLSRDRKRVSQETGETIETVQGKRLAFHEGELIVPAKGYVRGARGERLPRQEVIDMLEGRGEPGDEDYVQPHEHFGDMEEGFWLLAQAAPPLGEDETKGIVRLAIAGDIEALEGMLTAEQEGWERPEMVELLSDAIAQVLEARGVPAA